jgi:hypothetical protein
MELVVVPSCDQARYAGFRTASGHHPADPEIVVWWPELGPERLRGREFSRVTIVEDAFSDTSDRLREEALVVLKSRLRVPPMIWMEL